MNTESSNLLAPLADRMRPQKLNQMVGQEHLIGKYKILNTLIKQDVIPSMILWGPPGSGKTTLARIIAHETASEFISISAVLAGVKDIREVVMRAKETHEMFGRRNTILFIDEIHRFNKAQQDSLLPHVENGTIILIGATTENPSFEVISALLSRTKVLVLHELSESNIEMLIKRALKDKKCGLGNKNIKIGNKQIHHIAQFSNGDARTALNILELAVQISPTTVVTDDVLKEAVQKSQLLYDRAGDEHYNTISAFIKSMRASDVDAALYYLARMVEAGEDPLFIARRMVVFASEDIGMAQPTALVIANDVFRACETIGYPESQENLAHGVVYLALAKKDRSAYDAYMRALSDVKQYGNLPIPLEVRNAPTKLMKDLGYGKGYEMYPKKLSYLPQQLKRKKYYTNKI